MNNKSVVNPVSRGTLQSPVSGLVIGLMVLATILLAAVMVLPSLTSARQPPAFSGLSELSINPELKVLDYPDAGVASPDLYTNPELKALTYTIVDKAATQMGADGSVRTFPEAKGNGQYANPELRYLYYTRPARAHTTDLYANPELKSLVYSRVDKAAVQTVVGSEARTLQFPEALDNGLALNPELKYLRNSHP